MRPGDRRSGGLLKLAVKDIKALVRERDALREALKAFGEFPWETWRREMLLGPTVACPVGSRGKGPWRLLGTSDFTRARRALGLLATSSRRPSRRRG